MVFIDRDSKPAKCLCGCSLYSGILTVTILKGLGLFSAIATMNPSGVLWSLFECSILIALLYWDDNKTLA